jgi:hypothetical protein
VPALYGAQLYAVDLLDCAIQQLRRDMLDAAAIDAKALVPDDQRHGDCIEPKDQRPFLSDDMHQAIESVGLDRGNHGFVNGGDRTRMTARKCNQVLIGGLGGAKPLAQLRHGPFLKLDHASHERKLTRNALKSYAELQGAARA